MWGGVRILIYQRNNGALSVYKVVCAKDVSFVEGSVLFLLSQHRSYLGTHANDSWGSVPGSAGQVLHLDFHLVWSLFPPLSLQS
jgi:hypothetical protein